MPVSNSRYLAIACPAGRFCHLQQKACWPWGLQGVPALYLLLASAIKSGLGCRFCLFSEESLLHLSCTVLENKMV